MHRWKNLLIKRFTSFGREHSQLAVQYVYLPGHLTEGALPCAAVAFIIKVSDDGLRVLLTKRSSSLRSYGGDVCLPGGKHEPSDHSLVNTALRETQEEVGIDSHCLEHICTLPTFPAGIDNITAVTPVVFLAIDPPSININTSEVEVVFWVPLDAFFDENTRMPKSSVHKGKKFSNVAFSYYEADYQTTFLIWGFTARICVIVASVALNKTPYFPFTALSLLYTPNDGRAALVEVIVRNDASNNEHLYLNSKL